MTNEELDRLWFEAMHQSIEANENFVRYRFAALVAAAEKQKVVEYMNSRAFATGHGDTVEDLLKEMEWQVAEREREACAKVCDRIKNDIYNNSHEDTQPMAHAVANSCAAAIRARGSE